MNKKQHFHKYERMTWPNGKAFYKCMIVGCPHYLPAAELAVNRESLCWGDCNRLVTITKEIVQDKIWHPMCNKCKEERVEKKKEMMEI